MNAAIAAEKYAALTIVVKSLPASLVIIVRSNRRADKHLETEEIYSKYVPAGHKTSRFEETAERAAHSERVEDSPILRLKQPRFNSRNRVFN
jgi:hypothetical protein